MIIETLRLQRALPLLLAGLLASSLLEAQEIFIHRPDLEKQPVATHKRIALHGEYFGSLLYPGNFPGFNDLTGPEDQWLYGFQNLIQIGAGTRFLAQLLAHDDGGRRTKFDWHFSLRQKLMDNLVLIFGHDSNHDSDYQSTREGRAYYLNRNYVGFGLPFSAGGLYIEPFTWFFHHSNQKSHLDFSGEELRQEYGLRLGAQPAAGLTVSFQIIAQSDTIFSVGQSYLADLVMRLRATGFLELSAGYRSWKDIGESRLGSGLHYHQLEWGIAIIF